MYAALGPVRGGARRLLSVSAARPAAAGVLASTSASSAATFTLSSSSSSFPLRRRPFDLPQQHQHQHNAATAPAGQLSPAWRRTLFHVSAARLQAPPPATAAASAAAADLLGVAGSSSGSSGGSGGSGPQGSSASPSSQQSLLQRVLAAIRRFIARYEGVEGGVLLRNAWARELGRKYPAFHKANNVLLVAPLAKWVMVITPLYSAFLGLPHVMDIDMNQTLALAFTGLVWTYYCLLIRPTAWILVLVNFVMLCVNSFNIWRRWNFDRHLKADQAAAAAAAAVTETA